MLARSSSALRVVARHPLRAALRSFSTAPTFTQHVLPPLPAATAHDELPISPRQLEVHWDKHQRGYYNTINTLLPTVAAATNDPSLLTLSLNDLVARTPALLALHKPVAVDGQSGSPQSQKQQALLTAAKAPAPVVALANAACQALNHNVFFESLSAEAYFDLHVHRHLAHKLSYDFGSPGAAVVELGQKANAVFGSAWVFLQLNADNTVTVESYKDGESPVARGAVPLLALDLWEHAWYLDYPAARASFVEHVIRDGLNWDRAETVLAIELHRRGVCTVPGHSSSSKTNSSSQGDDFIATLLAAGKSSKAAASQCGHSHGPGESCSLAHGH